MADYMKIRDAVEDSCEFGPGHHKTPQALFRYNGIDVACVGVDYSNNFKNIVIYAGLIDGSDSKVLKSRNISLLRNILEELPEATLEFPVFNELPMALGKTPFIYTETYTNSDLALDMLDRLENVMKEFSKRSV